MRNRSKSKSIFQTLLPSSQAQLHSLLLSLLSPSSPGEQGMGVGVCSSHIVSATSSLSHSSLALVWCVSQRISLHKLLQCGFFKNLLHGGSFPRGAVPQELTQTAPAFLPCRNTVPCIKPVSVWALLHGVLPEACSSAGSSQATVPSRLIQLLQCGALHRLQVNFSSPVGLHG